MTRSRCLLWGVVPVLLWTSTLRAQPEITKECLTSSAPGQPCEAAARAYASHFVKVLAKPESNDDQVRDARSRLTDPYQRGGKAEFELLYSRVLGGELLPLMSADRPAGVRLNAMIITTRLTDPVGATKLVQIGVGDTNPGVRYWAGIAAREVSARGLDPKLQTEMGASLEKAIAKESSPYVRGPMVTALLNLTGLEATVLAALDRGVDTLIANPGASPAADMEGLVKVYQKLGELAVNNSDSNRAVIESLAKVSYRYLALAAIMLEDGKVPPTHRNQFSELVLKSDIALRWAVGKLNDKLAQPASITGDASLDKWANVRARNVEWFKLLTGELKLDPATLDVQVGK